MVRVPPPTLSVLRWPTRATDLMGKKKSFLYVGVGETPRLNAETLRLRKGTLKEFDRCVRHGHADIPGLT